MFLCVFVRDPVVVVLLLVTLLLPSWIADGGSGSPRDEQNICTTGQRKLRKLALRPTRG